MPCDKELYLLLLQNPEKGLERIMDEYMAFVCAIVSGKLSGICGRQDIEECVSDVFYEIYKTRHTIDLEKGSLKSYLAVLSKRTAIDFFRKRKKHSGNISLDAFEQDFIASEADIEKDILNCEESNLLISEIKALGEPDSQIIIRKYYFGQSAKIIGKTLGLKENTVNKRISRALVKLKEALGGVL